MKNKTQITEAYQKLISLALQADPLFGSQEADRESPTVFMFFFGNVGGLDIEIHKERWKPGVEADEKFSFRSSSLNLIEYRTCEDCLRKLIARQKNALEPTKAIQGTNNTTDPL